MKHDRLSRLSPSVVSDGSGVMKLRPRAVEPQRSHDRRGCTGPSEWLSVGTRNPGASSAVTAAPPSHRLPLENQGRQRCARASIRARDEAVHAGADDDDVTHGRPR